jgi:hypothetical protein
MTDLKAAEPDQLDEVVIDPESKPLSPDDPMEIKATIIAGDERLMMECLIEEFAHLGWGAKKIARMFDKPFYLASYSLEKRFGRQTVHECIEHTLARCGVFHVEMKESSARNKKFSTRNKATSTSGRGVATEEIQVIRIVES